MEYVRSEGGVWGGGGGGDTPYVQMIILPIHISKMFAN